MREEAVFADFRGASRPARGGICPWFAAVLALLSLMLPPARAAEQLNPTGRDITFDVPVRIDGGYAGDIALTITAEDSLLVDAESLRALAAPALKPDSLRLVFGAPAEETGGVSVVSKTKGPRRPPPALVTLLAPETDQAQPVDAARKPSPPPLAGQVSLNAVSARGLAAHYERESGEIRIASTIDQRPDRSLAFRAADPEPPGPPVAPSDASGYLNIRAAAAYVSQSSYGATGVQAPNFDFDGAMRIGGVVIEGEAALDTSRRVELADRSDTGIGFRRRGTRVVYDDPEAVVRLAAGDIYPGFSGFQASPDLLGISLERSYAKLSPGLGIRPSTEKSFRIEQPSDVDIVIDGVAVRRIRLAPGNYNVADLPLRPGANRVQLVITGDTGGKQTLEFTTISSQRLLAPGVDEWQFAAGVAANPDAAAEQDDIRARLWYGEPEYDFGAPAGTMFYRLGLTPALTVEANLQGDGTLAMGGFGFVTETVAGLFAGNIALSTGWDGAEAGFAAGSSWQSPRRPDGGLIKLAAEYVDAGFLTLSSAGYGRRPGVALAAYYAVPVAGLTASFAATYRNDFAASAAQEEWSADAVLSAEIADGIAASLSAGFAASSEKLGAGNCDCELAGLDGFRALLRLSYRPDHSSFVTLAHDTLRGGTYASYGRNAGSGAQAWSLSAGATHEAESEVADLDVAASYTGNRAEISLSHSARTEGISLDGAFQPESTEQRTSVRVQTAIAYAGGAFAVGRPITGGFAIIEPHEALGAPVTAGGESPTARSDEFGPALIPDIASYAPRRIEVDTVSDDSLSATAELRFAAPYKAGHRVTVGSAYTLTAVGTLIGPDGEPLAMRTGVAREEGREEMAAIEFFTNKTGRFAVEGVAPGRWRIEIAGEEPALRYQLDIPEDARGLVQTGTLRPAP